MAIAGSVLHEQYPLGLYAIHVFLSWPQGLLEPAQRARLRRAGQAILRSNLVAFAPDGSATCAFVYPSCVNGRPAHVADPLANDQDWALVYAGYVQDFWIAA